MSLETSEFRVAPRLFDSRFVTVAFTAPATVGRRTGGSRRALQSPSGRRARRSGCRHLAGDGGEPVPKRQWGRHPPTRAAAGARKPRARQARVRATSRISGGRSARRTVRTTLDSAGCRRPCGCGCRRTRMTTAGRMACSARQWWRTGPAANSLARCLAKRLASFSGGGASCRPSRASSAAERVEPCRVSSPSWHPARPGGLEDGLHLSPRDCRGGFAAIPCSGEVRPLWCNEPL